MDNMDKIKDFLYNVSDVLVTIIIIAIAALLISWRVHAIVEYPDTMLAEAENNASVSADSEGSSDNAGGAASGGTDETETNDTENIVGSDNADY